MRWVLLGCRCKRWSGVGCGCWCELSPPPSKKQKVHHVFVQRNVEGKDIRMSYAKPLQPTTDASRLRKYGRLLHTKKHKGRGGEIRIYGDVLHYTHRQAALPRNGGRARTSPSERQAGRPAETTGAHSAIEKTTAVQRGSPHQRE